MITRKQQNEPWWEKYREPSKFKNSKDFVDGYNQALEDFNNLFGTAKHDASIVGGNQVNKVCNEWHLEWSDEK